MGGKRFGIILCLAAFSLAHLMLSIVACDGQTDKDAGASVETPVIKVLFATTSSPNTTYSIRFRELMSAWDEATPNYRIVFEPHYLGEIFPGEQAVEALSSGALQMCGSIGSYQTEGFEPRFGIFQVAGLWEDQDHLARFYLTPTWLNILSELEEKGCKIIDYHDSWKWFYFKGRQVSSLEHFSALKIRCEPNPVVFRAVELLGGKPVSIPRAELTLAMQTGMFDGMIVSPSLGTIKLLGYLDFMDSCLDFQVLFNFSARGVNTSWWNDLPDEVKQAFEGLVAGWSRETKVILRNDIADGVERARSSIVITELTDDERQCWRQVLEPLQDEVSTRLGSSLLEAVLQSGGDGLQ